MGLLATVLTLAVGFGKKGLVNRFRSLLPKINLISAFVLVIVGIYVALYGIWSEQILDFDADPTPWIDSIVTTVEGWQAQLAGWFNDQVNVFGRTTRRTSVLGWTFLILNVGLAAAGLAVRQSRPSTPDKVLVDS